MKGYLEQEGIPTPDNPVEIKTQIIGKNLFETYEKDKEIQRQSKALCINDELLVDYKQRTDKAIEYIKENTKVIPFNEIGEGGGLELNDYDIPKLLKILGGDE